VVSTLITSTIAGLQRQNEFCLATFQLERQWPAAQIANTKLVPWDRRRYGVDALPIVEKGVELGILIKSAPARR